MTKGATQLIKAALQRSDFGLDVLQHAGDQSQLGMHSGIGDDATPTSIGHKRAHKRRVLTVTQRDVSIQDLAAFFCTGRDSPVSDASSTRKLTASSRRTSAGM